MAIPRLAMDSELSNWTPDPGMVGWPFGQANKAADTQRDVLVTPLL
jgi:hypothetical protein